MEVFINAQELVLCASSTRYFALAHEISVTGAAGRHFRVFGFTVFSMAKRKISVKSSNIPAINALRCGLADPSKKFQESVEVVSHIVLDLCSENKETRKSKNSKEEQRKKYCPE